MRSPENSHKASWSEKITRRKYLGILGGTALGAIVGGALLNRVFLQPDKKTAPATVDPSANAGPYVESGKSLVALVKCDDREAGIKKAVELLGGLSAITSSSISTHILVKPNVNTPDPYPACTPSATLRIILGELLAAGIPQDKILVSDLPEPAYSPELAFSRAGYTDVCDDLGISVHHPPSAEDDPDAWVQLNPRQATTWADGFRIARVALEAAKVISLPCMKHHITAKFTLSMKNSVGLIPIEDRLAPNWQVGGDSDRILLHNGPDMSIDLGSKIAELNLAYQTDLVVMDAMECFVTGGPIVGERDYPGLIIAGSDRLAIDTVAATLLKYYGALDLNVDISTEEQIARAREIGIGRCKKNEIALKTADLTTSASDLNDNLSYLDENLPT
ncbi:MAG: DUF362 domain-containing protein [Candidatus Heimdallarchaeota archaeon]